MSKYGNRTVRTQDGVFDGKREWQRWLFLRDEESRGRITDLRRQVKFELLPRQTRTVVVHQKRGDVTKEVFAEHPVSYVADFVYVKDGRTVVEDFKGVRTKDYVIKRKLMLYMHHIAVREVKSPAEE